MGKNDNVIVILKGTDKQKEGIEQVKDNKKTELMKV
jgi:hypothetical protein